MSIKLPAAAFPAEVATSAILPTAPVFHKAAHTTNPGFVARLSGLFGLFCLSRPKPDGQGDNETDSKYRFTIHVSRQCLKSSGRLLKQPRLLTRPPTGTSGRAIIPGEGLPILITSRQGSGRGCPLLRASNEHIPIVRVLRAKRASGCSLPILLRLRVARAQGTHRVIPPACGLFQHPMLLPACRQNRLAPPAAADRWLDPR